jgi:tRNA(Ile)-lysidine synthase
MCLLSGLLALQRELSVTIEVVHVDHGLRPESRTDAQFVTDECLRRGVPAHITSLDPMPDGVNLEAWSRESRYRYFARVQQEIAADWILTAHHANDAAETLLMQLISNKEPNGIRVRDDDRRLLRPLLTVRRAELERFAARTKTPFRNDASNDDQTFLRNRVRKTLLPLLEERFDPAVVASLADRALLLGEDERYLSSLAGEMADSVMTAPWGGAEWRNRLLTRLGSIPFSLRWRMVEEILRPDLGFSLGARRAVEGEMVVAGRLILRWVGGELLKFENPSTE